MRGDILPCLCRPLRGLDWNYCGSPALKPWVTFKRPLRTKHTAYPPQKGSRGIAQIAGLTPVKEVSFEVLRYFQSSADSDECPRSTHPLQQVVTFWRELTCCDERISRKAPKVAMY